MTLGGERKSAAAPFGTADDAPVSQHLTAREHLGALEVRLARRSWRNASLVGYTTAIFGFGAASFWDHGMTIAAALFGSVAAVFGYGLLTLLLNRTAVTLTPSRLRVSSGPLPLLRSLDVATEDILDVTAEQRGGGWSVAYRDQTGRVGELVGGVIDGVQAHAVARLLSERLTALRAARIPEGGAPVPWQEPAESDGVSASEHHVEDAVGARR